MYLIQGLPPGHHELTVEAGGEVLGTANLTVKDPCTTARDALIETMKEYSVDFLASLLNLNKDFFEAELLRALQNTSALQFFTSLLEFISSDGKYYLRKRL